MNKTNVLAYRCLLLLLVVCLFVTGAGTVGCKLLRRGSDHNTLPPLFFNSNYNVLFEDVSQLENDAVQPRHLLSGRVPALVRPVNLSFAHALCVPVTLKAPCIQTQTVSFIHRQDGLKG